MRYAPIRDVVWRAPRRSYIARREEPGSADNRKDYTCETLGALSKILDRNEYENMVSQWRSGFREIWLDNGFVMTRYTPPSGA